MAIPVYELAQRFVGEIKELPGPEQNHPFIVWALSLVGFGAKTPDEVPWCSAFVNAVHWICRLPRSKSAMARSWLAVGTDCPLAEALPGDVVVLRRGDGVQPGYEVLDAPGHVGFFAGQTRPDYLLVLGGNQGNAVSVQGFPVSQVLSIRRVQ